MAVPFQQGVTIAQRFEIERLVARGGMGVVYRALDHAEGGRPVALKVIEASPDAVENEDRFAREIGMLAGIRHPRIVGYVSHGATADEQPFLAMQWLDGEDLRAALGRGPLSLSDALGVLEGAAEALAAVHAMGIVHRDLKPANLFLRGGSCADLVLIDFGIARATAPSRRLTASGVFLGTPHYMAPEQASSGEALGPATDVFSLGAIFQECLTGKPPFDAPHLAGVLARILFDEPAPVLRLRPDVPRPWAELLARMLAKDPAHRPRDAGVLRELMALLPPAGEPQSAAMTAASSRRAGPFSSEEGGEQALVCVVLVTSPATALERLGEARNGLVRFGFTVERLADGSLIAAVSSKSAATDQARIAARGALYLRELLPEARIAVATGRALLRQTTRVGEAIDRAASLLSRPEGAEGSRGDTEGVWIDSVTAGLLDARFVSTNHGGGILMFGERPDADESRLLLGKPTPCVGREIELAQLEGLMARAVEDSLAQAVLLLAPAGTGKSRLRHELLRRLREHYPEATILAGYGDPLTAGSPYVLLSDALRRHAGIRFGDAPEAAREALMSQLCRHVAPAQRRRIGEFLGELCGVHFPGQDSPPLTAARSDPRVMSEQITQAFLDWVSAECQAHPLLLVLEDLQWGDALTVKLMGAALRDREEEPLFVLALGRPEVKNAFPGLLSERAQEISLRPLSRKASERLVKGVLGEAIGPETLARIVEISQGNALFLEELIRAAAEGKAGDVPPTVMAMIQSRLARLAPEARRALRAASIFGESFWLAPTRELCERWGASDEVAGWLERLVELELIERRRQSRFPDEVEYGFRHALVRDAAHSLLTEVDRRAGHLFAGQWLEAKGDTDAMVLAGHAEEGGDAERAIGFYTSAAEQSLFRNGFGEALARATRGIDCGAEGQAKGVLQSIQALASYGLGNWPQCGAVGLEAMGLLPRGGLWWCRTAEKLFHVLPQIEGGQRKLSIFDEMLATEPSPEARAAYVHALGALVLGFTVLGARDKARSCVELVNRVGSAVFSVDPFARAAALLWQAYYFHVLEPEPYLAWSLAEQSARIFAEGQVLHLLCMARALVGHALLELGAVANAEEVARSAVSVAEQMGDGYALANARSYLSIVLAGSAAPEKLEEAVLLAGRVLEVHISPSYDGCARWTFARVAAARGQWLQAEIEAWSAMEAVRTFSPAYVIEVASYLLCALVGQGRIAEAVGVAKKELEHLGRLGGVGFPAVRFLVAAAEVFFQAGEREKAERLLREALRQMELRAGKIPEAAVKERYLRDNPDNRRAFELERAWLEPGDLRTR